MPEGRRLGFGGGTCRSAASGLAAEQEWDGLGPAECGDLMPGDVAAGRLDPAEPADQPGEGALDLGAGEGRAEAEVRAGAELQVPARRAGEVEAVRLGELPRV